MACNLDENSAVNSCIRNALCTYGMQSR